MSDLGSSVTIFAGSATEAVMVRSFLESNGVVAHLVDEHIGVTAPHLAAGGGAGAVKVAVAGGEAERAKELLASRVQGDSSPSSNPGGS